MSVHVNTNTTTPHDRWLYIFTCRPDPESFWKCINDFKKRGDHWSWIFDHISQSQWLLLDRNAANVMIFFMKIYLEDDAMATVCGYQIPRGLAINDAYVHDMISKSTDRTLAMLTYAPQ